MQLGRRRLARPLIITAAAAFGLGGLFVAPAAFADVPSQNAPVSGSAYEQEAKTLLGDPTIQAVGKDADGNIVVVKTPGDASQGLDALTAQYDNVVVKQVTAPLKNFAATDVVGGAGYITTSDPSDDSAPSFLCSIGFTAWTPTGGPAVISAGHCADDGSGAPANTVSVLSLPSGDQAGGGNDSTVDASSADALGTFGFHQFGGEGTTAGTDNSTDDIDVSVIDVTNPNLSLLPKVTDWTSSASEDLSTSGTTISSVGAAVAGQSVSKSGRTTGTNSGTVEMVDGWADISGHLVYGFGAGLHSDHGDSGGAFYQGNAAVGILSGGGTLDDGSDFTWASDLQNDLAHTGGYTVRLALTAPAVSSPADGSTIATGSTISGTGPANTTVLVTPTGGAAQSVTADGSGNWSITAPNTPGAFGITVQAQNGFNLSSTNSYQFTVKPAAPVITSPVVGNAIAPISEITGTGLPGATVTVSGTVEGIATVGPDGTWSVPANVSYGLGYSVSATQAIDGESSDAATTAFNVYPSSLVVTTPAEEAQFSVDKPPTTISGTGGIEGATITLYLGHTVLGTTTVGPGNGDWSFPITVPLAVGEHTFDVAQTINGASSGVEVDVMIVAAPAPPAVSNNPPKASTVGTTVLADTGSDVDGASLIGALLIAAGLGATILVRRRRSAQE